ncbi:MAG TPA: addiction module protein [Rhizomicrobium sp.]|jgi:putative addiction module component (TIGR02574 family)|nr:addiction module protein [Rhizomicrobium sp.]
MNDIRDLFKLPADEKLELVDALLDSLGDEELPPLSDAMKAELERRVAEHEADPSSAIPWEMLREELRARFK